MNEQLPASELSSRARSASLLFTYGFGNAAAYVIARTVADSQFLSRVGPEQLPKVYLAAAGTVAMSSAIYARMIRGRSVRGSVITTLALLSVVTALLPILVDYQPYAPLSMTVVYLVAQIRGSLGTIQFTMLLNEQFAQRQPERVVGILGGGATLAGFLVGIILGHFSNVHDLSAILFVAALIDLATIIPVRLLPPGRKFESGMPEEFFWLKTAPQKERATDRTAYPWKLAAMVSVGVVAATLVEFQWKVSVADHFHRNEESLARYFGAFYGWVYLVTGLLQFFMAGQLLRKRGVIFGLLMFPLSLLLTGLGVLAASTGRTVLLAITLAKGCDALKRGVHDPSLHILYSPLPSQLRHQVVTFVAGIVKPLSEALASVLLILAAASLSRQNLSVAVVLLAAGWIILAMLVWRGFISERRKIVKKQRETRIANSN